MAAEEHGGQRGPGQGLPGRGQLDHSREPGRRAAGDGARRDRRLGRRRGPPRSPGCRDRRNRCDVAIVDIFLKSGSGLGVLKAMGDRADAPQRVVLSNHATPEVRAKRLELARRRRSSTNRTSSTRCWAGSGAFHEAISELLRRIPERAEVAADRDEGRAHREITACVGLDRREDAVGLPAACAASNTARSRPARPDDRGCRGGRSRRRGRRGRRRCRPRRRPPRSRAAASRPCGSRSAPSRRLLVGDAEVVGHGAIAVAAMRHRHAANALRRVARGRDGAGARRRRSPRTARGSCRSRRRAAA